MQPPGRLALEEVLVQLLILWRLWRLAAALAQPAMPSCVMHGAEQVHRADRGDCDAVAQSGGQRR